MDDNKTIGIIVTHGYLARELLSTVEHIVGKVDFCHTLSNVGLNNETFIHAIRTVIENNKGAYVIIFVDYFGGSCSMNCVRAVKDYKRATIISGVNLPILLDFITKRGKMKPEEIVEHLIRRGQESVKVIDF